MTDIGNLVRKLIKFFLGFHFLNRVVATLFSIFGLEVYSRRAQLLSKKTNEPVQINIEEPHLARILMFPSYKGFVDKIAHRNFIYGWNDFEKPLPFIINKLMEQSHVFIDIGANTGFYSLLAASHTDKKILSFEPYPAVFESLQANIDLNNKQNEISALQVALSDANGDLELFIPQNDHGFIETSASLNQHFKKSHGQVVQVEVKTMDSVVEKNNLEKIDLIKIDVESLEKKVLAGAKKTIEDYRPIIILEILDAEHIDWFKGFLAKNNYIAFSIGNELVENQSLTINELQPNFIFCPDEKLALISNINFE